jgi:hypothetical protein
MTQISDYERDFVIRTQALLRDYKGEYKLSNAINCMLGLIVLPNEMIERSHNLIWELPITEIAELNYLRIKVFKPVKKKRRDEIEYFPKTLQILLKKVRNGLAHQNILPINTNGIFTGISIKNYYGEGRGKILDLEIEFDRRELERFALFISEKYLEPNDF